MRKIIDLPDGTTVDDLTRLSDRFKHPIAIKLRRNLELWCDISQKSDWDEIDWTDESGSIAFREHEKKIAVEKLRTLYHHLASDAPSPDSPHWGEYEETMRQLEAELREKGVSL